MIGISRKFEKDTWIVILGGVVVELYLVPSMGLHIIITQYI